MAAVEAVGKSQAAGTRAATTEAEEPAAERRELHADDAMDAGFAASAQAARCVSAESFCQGVTLERPTQLPDNLQGYLAAFRGAGLGEVDLSFDDFSRSFRSDPRACLDELVAKALVAADEQ